MRDRARIFRLADGTDTSDATYPSHSAEPAMTRILGVLDVKGGVVVRGVGGRRAEYRPLPGAPSPLEAARTMGVREVYLADLDAIEGAAPALAVYRSLASEFRLWVDAGVRTAADRARLSGPWRTVVGLETAEGPSAIQ